MNPKTYKKEFSIFVYDENPVQARYLKEILSRAGYEVHFYTSEELFLQAIYLTLPHIILLPCLEKTAHLASEIKKISREIQIFATGSSSDGERLHRLLEQKLIYDYILEPVTFSAQLIHRIERGVEAWLVTIVEENKQIAPFAQANTLDFIETKTPEVQQSSVSYEDMGLSDLLLCESEEVAVQFALKKLQDFCQKDFVFLKYDFHNETLNLMDVASGMIAKYRQIGIKLENIQDKSHFFLHTQDYKIWTDFFAKVFATDQTFCVVLKNKETPLGCLVATAALNEQQIKLMGKFSRALELILDSHFKSRFIFDHIPVEMKTLCLHNRAFYEKLNNEVARSRRYGNTLSLLTFQVQAATPQQKQKGMMLLAKILKRFTRCSDFVGRISEQTLVVALPQTAQEKSAFAGSRLSLIAKSAFKEQNLNAEVFCGANVFPDLASDTMSLLEGSEEAATQAQAFEVVLYTIETDNQREHDIEPTP